MTALVLVVLVVLCVLALAALIGWYDSRKLSERRRWS